MEMDDDYGTGNKTGGATVGGIYYNSQRALDIIIGGGGHNT
jgi:hypothetical protein